MKSVGVLGPAEQQGADCPLGQPLAERPCHVARPVAQPQVPRPGPDADLVDRALDELVEHVAERVVGTQVRRHLVEERLHVAAGNPGAAAGVVGQAVQHAAEVGEVGELLLVRHALGQRRRGDLDLGRLEGVEGDAVGVRESGQADVPVTEIEGGQVLLEGSGRERGGALDVRVSRVEVVRCVEALRRVDLAVLHQLDAGFFPATGHALLHVLEQAVERPGREAVADQEEGLASGNQGQ